MLTGPCIASAGGRGDHGAAPLIPVLQIRLAHAEAVGPAKIGPDREDIDLLWGQVVSRLSRSFWLAQITPVVGLTANPAELQSPLATTIPFDPPGQ